MDVQSELVPVAGAGLVEMLMTKGGLRRVCFLYATPLLTLLDTAPLARGAALPLEAGVYAEFLPCPGLFCTYFDGFCSRGAV